MLFAEADTKYSFGEKAVSGDFDSRSTISGSARLDSDEICFYELLCRANVVVIRFCAFRFEKTSILQNL